MCTSLDPQHRSFLDTVQLMSSSLILWIWAITVIGRRENRSWEWRAKPARRWSDLRIQRFGSPLANLAIFKVWTLAAWFYMFFQILFVKILQFFFHSPFVWGFLVLLALGCGRYFWNSCIAHARLQRQCTALILAAQFGHLECVRLLLDGGADIDATNMVRVKLCCWSYSCTIHMIVVVSFDFGSQLTTPSPTCLQ